MADDETKQSAIALQERGHFWWAEELPPDRHQIPPSAVTGELRITAEGRITVQLDGLLHRQPREPFHTSNRAEFEALRARRIRGILKDSGRGVLLFDLAQAGARHSSYAVSTEGFSAAHGLIGTRRFDDRMIEPTFSYIDADLTGFEEWLRTRALELKYGKVVSIAKYRKPKPHIYELQTGRLSLVRHLVSSSKGHSDLSWSVSAYLRFEPKKSFDMKAAIDWHRWLQDLMILLTDSDYRLDWPEVRWGEQLCTLYFYWMSSNTERPRFHECPTNFPKLQESFGNLVQSWLDVRDRYGPGVYLYLSTRRGMQLYAENQFITLVSGIESFHRTKYGDPRSRTALAKLDKVVAQIATEKDRTWAADHLEYTVLPNLEQRIFETLDALSLGFDGKRLRAFSADCAKLRNELAHHGGNRNKTTAYTDFISSVLKMNNALGTLSHALALTEIGLDQRAVRAWTVESPQAFLRNWYFAEVRLIDHADK